KPHSKLAYDLKFTQGCIRRQVIRCRSALHWCEDCCRGFSPERLKRMDKHLHGLKSWAVYQHVVHRVNLSHVQTMFRDWFDLGVSREELHRIRALMADRYRKSCERSLGRIVAGKLAHADETEVKLHRGKGYVWVLASLEDVVYVYRPNREAAFLHDLLKGFTGV